MNIQVSEDQNEITVRLFAKDKEPGLLKCSSCFFDHYSMSICEDIPCEPKERNDKRDVYFTQKT